MTPQKQALITYGGWEGHEPAALAERYAGELEQLGFAVTSTPDLTVFADEEGIQRFDLIVPFWTMAELPEGAAGGMFRAVRGGAGLVGMHSAADAFRNDTAYQFLLGGQFVWHPNEDVTFEIRFVDRDDELTKGIEDFTVTGEQYYLHVDPAVHVLATTTVKGDWPTPEEDVTMPAVWRRRFDQGRVFYCSVGHALADHDIPEMRELMHRAFAWAAR